MSKYVVSTMSTSINYCVYADVVAPADPRQLPQLPDIRKKIFIQGGAGMPDAKSGFGERTVHEVSGAPIWTPRGIPTEISDEDAELLEVHPIFQKHVKAGLVQILDKDPGHDHKKMTRIVQEMTEGDGFHQLRDGDKRIKGKLTTHPDDLRLPSHRG
jgi:hypothetical protein